MIIHKQKGGLGMYYQDLESYMQEVLGYKRNDNFAMNWQPTMYIEESGEQECEKFYPLSYTKIYPIIENVCLVHSNEMMTEELLQKMVEETCVQLQEKNVFTIVEAQNNRTNEKRGEARNDRNSFIRDLLRIWLLKEFFKRPSHRPPRPPMRPPYPGENRPPIMPREGKYPLY